MQPKEIGELIKKFTEAVRAHDRSETTESVHNYRMARSELACRFHKVLEERDEARKLMDVYEDSARKQPGFWGGLAADFSCKLKYVTKERDEAFEKGQQAFEQLQRTERELNLLRKYIDDLRKAHNQSDVLVHELLQKGPPTCSAQTAKG